MDEVGLIRAAQKGDLTAFNRLVLAYQDKAYGVAYSIMGDPDQAADATQTAFLSAFRSIKKFRGGSFNSWILRITTNACYDELRRQKRRPQSPLNPSTDYDEEVESPSWLTDPGEGPEEAVERAALNQAIERCIQELPPEFRAVVVLVDLQGLNYAEAAEAVGRPVGTIKSRLARARVQVRDCLQAFRELLPREFRLDSESAAAT
jgi:RNA polymerase sigma-70 factor (ECF subfamily)